MEERKIFLLPGEYHISRSECEIATLLGSCVAVTLKHKEQPFGAMNHYLLSAQSDYSTVRSGHDDKGRYGDIAIDRIVHLMQKLESDFSKVVAGVYGGAAVVSHLTNATGDIGVTNIEMAHQKLKEYGIKIVDEDTGGTKGRRIYLNTASGNVTVKTLERTSEVERIEKNREYVATRNPRVLIVDDSPLVRKILRAAIESYDGIEVCGEAGDAYEARDLIVSEQPDVVSLDIIMPRMDGLKFLHKLSQHFPVPVVICSTIAKTGSQIARKAKELGAVDIVDKDALEIYKGMDAVKRAYIPKLINAAKMAVNKRQ